MRRSGMRMGFCGAILMVLAVLSAPAQIGADEDLTGALQLFEFSTTWYDVDGPGVPELLDALGAWHTAPAATPTPTPGTTETPTPVETPTPIATPTPVTTPTATPTAGPTLPAGRILRFPPMAAAPLRLFQPGLYVGSPRVPVAFSDLNGVTRIEFVTPARLGMPGDFTQATVSLVELGDHAQGFALQHTETEEGLVITLVRDAPATHTAQGEIVRIYYDVVRMVQGGMKPAGTEELPLTIVRSEVEGAGGEPIDHVMMDGVLLVDDGVVDVTPTPGEPEARLELTACSTRGFVGGTISIQVDFVDALGRNINPGTPSGREAAFLTVGISGAGRLPNGQTAVTVRNDNPFGGPTLVTGVEAGTAIVSATLAGYASPEPLVLEFAPGARVAGQIRIFDAALEDFRPATFQEAQVQVYHAGTNTLAAFANIDFLNPGIYTTGPMDSGTYDVVISARQHIPGIQAVCVPGIDLTAGETRENVDADLAPFANTARFFGTITANDGMPLADSFINLNSPGTVCDTYPQTSMNVLPMPQDPLPFEMHVPPGEYHINISSGSFAYGSRIAEPILITIPETELDVTVYRREFIRPLYPLNYTRVAPVFSLQWEPPLVAGDWEYSVQVMDRCNTVIWRAEGITGVSVPYGGPPLDPLGVYTWTIGGFSSDGLALGLQDSSIFPSWTVE